MRIRPQEWLDRYLQFVGRERRNEDWPIPVAIWQDGRGVSSREAAPYQAFSVIAGNPGAGNHWCYTYTPAIASKALTIRLCWLKARVETATATLGVRIGTATAKAATNAVFPIGDADAALGGTWTVDEVANANVPLTLFNLFYTATAGEPAFAVGFPYPEYFLEAVILQGQVLEIISSTQDDAFSLALGHYAVPIA